MKKTLSSADKTWLDAYEAAWQTLFEQLSPQRRAAIEADTTRARDLNVAAFEHANRLVPATGKDAQ